MLDDSNLVQTPLFRFHQLSHFLRHFLPISCRATRLSHNSFTLARWWAWWWRIAPIASVCWLRVLKLDTILLAVVVLACAIVAATVVARVRVGCRVWRRRRSIVIVVAVGIVVVVGLRVGVIVCVGVIAWARSPAGAIEGLATGLATTTCGYATVIELSGHAFRYGFEV